MVPENWKELVWYFVAYLVGLTVMWACKRYEYVWVFLAIFPVAFAFIAYQFYLYWKKKRS